MLPWYCGGCGVEAAEGLPLTPALDPCPWPLPLTPALDPCQEGVQGGEPTPYIIIIIL